MNWSTSLPSNERPLLDLVNVVGGGTPSRSEPRYWGGDIPWASVKDLSGTTIANTMEYITREGLANSAANVVPAGAIVLATRIVPGRAALATIDLAINQDLKGLLVEDSIEPAYLLQFIHSIAPRLSRLSSGSTVKGITLDTLSRVRVPVPPVAEQRRIAATFDKIDSIRRKRRESLRLLDRFLRSTFLEMFGNPIRNEKGWVVASATSVIEGIEAGTSVKEGEARQGESSWAVLKISAVTSGWYLATECKTVAIPPQRLVVPRRGDLLFSRANTRELVAATCLVNQDVERLFLPDKLWRITPDPTMATAEYLRFLLADPGFRETLTRHATGTSGSMLNVSQEKVLRLQLPMPPVALQKMFGEIVWSVYNLRARIREAIERTGHVVNSLASDAFPQNSLVQR